MLKKIIRAYKSNFFQEEVKKIKKTITLSEKKLNSNTSEKLNSLNTKIKKILKKNKNKQIFIGQNYNNSYIPLIAQSILKEDKTLLQDILKNPEKFQGSLEIIFNLQELMKKILIMDEVTFLIEPSNALIQAIWLSYKNRNEKKKKMKLFKKKNKILVSKNLFENQIGVLENFCFLNKIEIIYEDLNLEIIKDFKNDIFAAVFQFPDKFGFMEDFSELREFLEKNEIDFILGVDIFNSFYNQPPGELNADICYGSLQRLGIPVSFHGATNCFIGAKKKYNLSSKSFYVSLKKESSITKSENFFDFDNLQKRKKMEYTTKELNTIKSKRYSNYKKMKEEIEEEDIKKKKNDSKIKKFEIKLKKKHSNTSVLNK